MKVRDGVRQTMAWLHGWAGLLLGWALYVIALAGTLSVYRPEIGRWMRPENRQTAAPIDAVAAAVAWLHVHAVTAPGWYLDAPGPRTNTTAAVWFTGKDFMLRALDPVSGAPVARTTLGGDFFYRLHFELQLPYPYGSLLASLAGSMMLLALITGIIAHRRFFRDFFTFRPGRGQRAWLDGHNALGVLALPFHIMITFTGLVTLATLTMPWAIAATYGRDRQAAYREMSPGALDRPASGRPGTLAPLRPMLADAARRFGGGAIGSVHILTPADAASLVIVYQAEDRHIAAEPRVVSYDGTTGRVLADYRERRPAVLGYRIVYGLHLARFAPELLRALYFVSGLALTGAIATGLVLWTVKRRERAPLERGNGLVERLNVAALLGTPIAFAAFFWANRLLPLTLADRDDAEVRATFAVWGIVLLLAAGTPVRIGTRIAAGAAAAAWLALPVVDVAAIGFADRDSLRWIGDGLMAAAGGGFAGILLGLRRKPSERRR